MVRFIILIKEIKQDKKERFTFQYGQIYYFVIGIAPTPSLFDLHSNMVRFIMYSL